MQNVIYNISQLVGITVLHSLWQGLIIYSLLRIALSLAAGCSPAVKHNIALAGLFGTATWFFYTLFNQAFAYSWINNCWQQDQVLSQISTVSFNKSVLSNYYKSYYHRFAALLPYISGAYFAGLIFKLSVIVIGRNRFVKLKKMISIDIALLKKTTGLAAVLDISTKVSIGLNELVTIPCVTGFLKPVILLPVSICTSLLPDEVEAILLHELAHIKRNDFLINFFQQSIAAILFFNPFVALMGRIMNEERENSCDDIVVQATQKPLVYAHALLKLKQNQNTGWQLALAASGDKYYLLNRIKRIMKTKQESGARRHAFLIVLLFAACLSSIAWLNPKNTRNVLLKPNEHKTSFKLNSVKADTDTITTVSENLKVHGDTAKHAKHKRRMVYSDLNGTTGYHSYNDLTPEQKRQVDAAAKQGEEMAKQFNSPEWKTQIDRMAKEGAEKAKQYNSPEWKAQVDRMAKEGAEMAKKFNSPEWKAQVDRMAKEGAEMAKKFNSPEWKAQVDRMAKEGAEMAKKFNSPEWKKQVEQWNTIPDNNKELKEKPEQPEKPEKPEKKEAPEMNN